MLGMDFGTTNSGISLYDGRRVELLPLDPANANPRVARSALYITNDQKVSIARAALQEYFEQNLGRTVRLERVWVGEIEQVFAELPAFIRDVYAWVDANSPGRLLISFKSGLREADYAGTIIGQFFLSLEDLIGSYLYTTRLRAERILGRPQRAIVLGRPVRFAADPQADQIAQERLIEAALRAGYERIALEYEPIAAAYHYAAGVRGEENILVFDFGGGTLDLTVMRIGPQRREVLATGGLPIAGDVFDQKLVRAKLAEHFGEHTVYGPRQSRLPVPSWIYDTLADWQTLVTLQSPENRRMLDEIKRTAQEPRRIQALVDLVANNYGLRLFEAAETAKRQLSRRLETEILLAGPSFTIRQPVTRVEFETIIRAEIQSVDALIDDTLARSGLAPREIDAVIRTGGSSEIPVFQRMLAHKFGEEKVRSIDIFSSVTSGLGLIAQRIEAGEIEATATSRDDRRHADLAFARPGVAQANLEVLKRRILAQEELGEGEEAAAGLVMLGEGRLMAGPLVGPETGETPLAEIVPDGAPAPRVALTATLDEPLLVVTSRYRLFLTTLRQLATLQEGGFSRADLPDFAKGEIICAVRRWNGLKDTERLLIVTSRGAARALNMARLRPTVEGGQPLKLDWPYPHWPAAVLSGNVKDSLLVVTGSGRAARMAVADVSVQGSQVIGVAWDKGERIASALRVAGQRQVIVLTSDGYARRFPAVAVPLVEKASQGVTSIRRPVAAVGLRAGDTMLAITSRRCLPFHPDSIPLESEPSVRSHRLFKLASGETVTALISPRPARPPDTTDRRSPILAAASPHPRSRL
ncbi:MAG: Hsp70 family protein [Anaerolineae bacterium]